MSISVAAMEPMNINVSTQIMPTYSPTMDGIDHETDSELMSSAVDVFKLLATLEVLILECAIMMRDFSMQNNAVTAKSLYQNAHEALDKKIQSAEDELSAQKAIYTVNFIASLIGLGVGVVIAGVFLRPGSATLDGSYGMSMIAQGVTGPGTQLANTAADWWNKPYLIDAQILGSQADNQVRLLSIHENTQQRFEGLSHQGSDQITQITQTAVQIYQALCKVFENPLTV
jgi:hypothetical protein